MKFLVVIMVLWATSQQVLAKCDRSSTDTHSDLHWSDNRVTPAPDCSASIEVRADPEGDAAAKVYLRRGNSAAVQMPFNVFRDGTLYWEHTAKRIAYQDAHSYGVYRLWLVDIDSEVAHAPQTMLSDNALRKAVEERLSESQNIARFWPDLAAWFPDRALVTVRVQTLIGSSGPLTEHCLGFLVSTVRENQVTSVSATDLKAKYKVSCQRNEK